MNFKNKWLDKIENKVTASDGFIKMTSSYGNHIIMCDVGRFQSYGSFAQCQPITVRTGSFAQGNTVTTSVGSFAQGTVSYTVSSFAQGSSCTAQGSSYTENVGRFAQGSCTASSVGYGLPSSPAVTPGSVSFAQGTKGVDAGIEFKLVDTRTDV